MSTSTSTPPAAVIVLAGIGLFFVAWAIVRLSRALAARDEERDFPTRDGDGRVR